MPPRLAQHQARAAKPVERGQAVPSRGTEHPRALRDHRIRLFHVHSAFPARMPLRLPCRPRKPQIGQPQCSCRLIGPLRHRAVEHMPRIENGRETTRLQSLQQRGGIIELPQVRHLRHGGGSAWCLAQPCVILHCARGERLGHTSRLKTTRKQKNIRIFDHIRSFRRARGGRKSTR